MASVRPGVVSEVARSMAFSSDLRKRPVACAFVCNLSHRIAFGKHTCDTSRGTPGPVDSILHLVNTRNLPYSHKLVFGSIFWKTELRHHLCSEPDASRCLGCCRRGSSHFKLLFLTVFASTPSGGVTG